MLCGHVSVNDGSVCTNMSSAYRSSSRSASSSVKKVGNGRLSSVELLVGSTVSLTWNVQQTKSDFRSEAVKQQKHRFRYEKKLDVLLLMLRTLTNNIDIFLIQNYRCNFSPCCPEVV